MTPHKNGTFRIDIQELSSVETLSNPTIYISMSNLYGTPRFVVYGILECSRLNKTILNFSEDQYTEMKMIYEQAFASLYYISVHIKIEVSNPWIIMHI